MGNFDFEEYQKLHEGLFQRFKRWASKHIKFIAIVTTAAAIAGIIGTIKQCTTTDAGLVIERIYNETRNDIELTKKSIDYVQLPDSIENTTEVQRYRAYQHKVLAYSIFFNSIIKEPHLYYSENENVDKKKIDYLEFSSYSLTSIMQLGTYNQDIIMDTKAIVNGYVDCMDSLALFSINMFLLNEAHYRQLTLNKYLIETKDLIDKYKRTNDVDKVIDVMVSFFSSKELYDCYRYLHKSQMMILNSVNIRLINIKLNNIKKNHGCFEDKEEDSSGNTNNVIDFSPSSFVKEHSFLNSIDL